MTSITHRRIILKNNIYLRFFNFNFIYYRLKYIVKCNREFLFYIEDIDNE